METKPLKIALVDDSPFNREQLSRSLERFNDRVELVSVAESGEAFLKWLRLHKPSLHPQVVLMDIEMPRLSGIETLVEAQRINPDIKYLMLTVFEDEEMIFKAIKAGAMGYLLKEETAQVLVDSVEELVADQGSPMSALVARKVLKMIAKGEWKPDEGKRQEMPNPLGIREQEILSFAAEGFDYKEIALKIGVSPHTVRTHFTNIYKKLQVNSKMEAVQEAQKQNWIP